MLPWKQTSPETEQFRFIERWLAGEVTFVELCRQFGVSRKTGYKRVLRYRCCGWEGLGDRSRATCRHPNETPLAVAEQLIAARQAHPTWGTEETGGTAASCGARGVVACAQHRREYT